MEGENALMRPIVLCLLLLPAVSLAQTETVKVAFDKPGDRDAWLADTDTWIIEDGALRQTQESLRGTLCFLPRCFSDLTIQARFFIHPVGRGVKAPGLIYRAMDEETFYYIHYDSKNSQVVWVRSEPGLGWTSENTHRHRPVTISEGEWHTAKVEVAGATHKVYLDGELLFTQEDDKLTKGVVGLRCGQGDVSFDDFQVTGIPATLEEEFTVTRVPYMTVCADAGAGAYEAFPDVCRTKDGELLVVFYAGYTHVSFPTDDLPKGGRICMVRSQDEGQTWSEAEVVVDTPIDDRDSSITQLGSGDLLVTYMSYYGREHAPTHEVFTVRSSDNGATWTEPKKVPVPFDGTQAVSEPVTELQDGTLLLPVYGRYLDADYQGSPCAVLRSHDGGESWPDCTVIEPVAGENLHEPSIEVLPDGRIFMLIRPGMYWSVSEDDGVTWSPPEEFGISGDAPYLLLTSRNILLAGFRHHPTSSTSLAYSTDFGETWHGPQIVDHVIGGYPSMAELPDGRVIFVYYTEGSGSDIRCVFLNATADGVEVLPLAE